MLSIDLTPKIESFKQRVSEVLEAQFGQDPSRVVMATAWLVSDNVLVDLLWKHTNFRPTIVAVDTLHLFPETLQVADEMQEKYGFNAQVYKPFGVNSREEFIVKYGRHEFLSASDFDKHSKVDPLRKSFEDFDKAATITGRRADQGNARVDLAVWEADNDTFNPLADWSWDDICAYVLQNDVPYNSLHKVVNVSSEPVDAIIRDSYENFEQIELPLPFFAYSQDQIDSLGKHVYVWKSFGDFHTSVPVKYPESERAGRFVARAQTECGIHTRLAKKGAPHGGKLIDRVVPLEQSNLDKVKTTLHLNERQICDLELLSNGGFSPLTGFMTRKDYEPVLEEMRLAEGQLFGLPVTLDTSDESIEVGDYIELTGFQGRSVMLVEDKWIPDRVQEAKHVYGTDSLEHPAVRHLLTEKGKFNIGGTIWTVDLPKRDWVNCKTPKEVRNKFRELNRESRNLVAFQCRNPLHRAHVAMLLKVAETHDAEVLVHPVVGPTKDDDIPAIVRKDTYDALEKKLTNVHFEYVPYNMMVGGPREALQHAIVRKNFGCTGMIVGRDHAGCKDASGNDFYGPYDAQELLEPLQEELQFDIIQFQQMVYAEEAGDYIPADEAKAKGYKGLSISGTKFRKMLIDGDDIPTWFAFPEVVEILRKHAKRSQG
jgi:sulfate adenylyltransferase